MPRTKTRAKRTSAKRTVKKRGPRASWRGMVRFGLVSFAVQAVNAHDAAKGAMPFHQLHAECHRRIRYEKVCPVHGEVSQDEIVSGFEYAKGRYVEIEPEELEALRSEKERALNIDAFVEPELIDPIFYDGRMYYLVPDGDESREPYGILLEAMRRAELVAVGQIVFSGKEQLVAVRAIEGALHMGLLNYAAEMRSGEELVGALPRLAPSDKKLRLAAQLIESWRDDDFDLAEYEDHHLEKVQDIVDAKLKGKEVVAPEEEEPESDVINLMDALKKSLRVGKEPRRRERTPTSSRSRGRGSKRRKVS